MNTKRYLALVMALVMAFSLVVPVSAAAPTSVEKLSHSGAGTHDTAILTVYVGDLTAAVGSIDSDMKATLVLNYGNYKGNSTVTVAGQTENHANLTTFTLNGSSNSGSNSGIELTTNNIYNYFPGLERLTESGYAIKFVDELGTTSKNWNYTFRKAANDSGVTLEVIPGNSDIADDRWQALKDEAFKETHENDENSFIKLAAGSYLQMDKEKLTVVNDDLWLDDFSNADSVDANVTNAQNKLELTPESTTAYQLLLKQGTQFALGHSIATVVNQDLLITMSNVTKKYTDPILRNVYNSLTPETEEALAENLLKVFSEIAGLVQSTDPEDPVVITFGRPATEVAISDPVVVDNTTTSTAIAVDTTGTTATYNIKTTTTTTTTTESGDESTTTTTTKPVTVDTATAATVDSGVREAAEQDSVTSIVVDEVDAYADNNNSATFMAALESGGTVTAENVLKTTAAAKAIATAAAQVGVTVSEITKAEVILQTTLTAVGTNQDSGNRTVTYDITPVAQLYSSGTRVGNAVKLKNEDIKPGQTFTFNIPVPSTITSNFVKVTHTSAEYNSVDANYYEVQGTGGVRYVTVTVSHFSTFELEAIEDSEISSGFDHRWSLSLDDEIAINLYFAPPETLSNPEEYTVEYYTTVNSTKGEKQTKQFNELNKYTLTNLGDYYYIQLAKFAAKQMTDTVTVTLKHGNTVIETWEYSIKSYCNTVIENTGGDFTLKLQNLCKAVLEYGAYAQRYFHYKESDLAYEGSQYYTFKPIPDDYVGNSFGDTGILKNLYLEDRVTINFYVPATYAENNNVNVVADEGLQVTQSTVNISSVQYTMYSVSGFAAKMLNQTVTVTVNGNVYTWSPLSYAYQNQNSVNTDLANVVHALYNYYVYADKYFNS